MKFVSFKADGQARIGAFDGATVTELSSLPAGQYMVNIRQISPVTGRMVKQGAYRIVKIK